MNVERIPVTDRASWIARRHKDVTASVIGALFGEHPYVTPLELYLEKSNETPPEDRDNAVLSVGRRLESAVAATAVEQEGWEVEKDDSYYRWPELRIGATPDFRVVNQDRVPFQAKTVDPRVYERDWIGGEPPLWIQLQALTEAMVLDAPYAWVGGLILKRDYPLVVHKVERNPGAEKRIIKAVQEFWANIAAKNMPAPNYGRDGAIIAALYKDGGAAPLDLSTHNRISFLCEEKLEWMRRATNADRALETIDAEIEDVLKNAERATHPEFNITWKLQKRRGYIVEPGTCRVLRVTRKHAKPDEEAAA
jgi:predicted phage-related endonuclease